MANKKDVETVKKIYADKIQALKKEEAEAVKQAKAKNAKAQAAERAKLRKADAKIKIIIGGWWLAQMKKSGDLRTIDLVMATLKNDKDKELFKSLKVAISQQSTKKPETQKQSAG